MRASIPTISAVEKDTAFGRGCCSPLDFFFGRGCAAHGTGTFKSKCIPCRTNGCRVTEGGYVTYTQSMSSIGTMTDKYRFFPASKLGEYTVSKEIAEGTFAKVKSELTKPFSSHFRRLNPFSGRSHHHWTNSCYEIHFESGYTPYQDKDPRQTRSRIYAYFETSPHHQTVVPLAFVSQMAN
jgi:hypothetical protein